VNDFNDSIINQFRENAGKVGAPFEGMSLLLLHSTRAKSGEERVHPVVYNDLDGRYAIFASMAGGPKNPAWYHNLVAHPDVSIEIGTETVNVTARVTEGDERSSIWEPWKTAVPTFVEYEQKTSREIPVIVLEPRSLAPPPTFID
jgi:deazaflavin-dependent oxidoreductase (nitroreductase family)